MDKVIVIILVLVSFAAMLFLNKYRDTKAGLLFRFCWFVIILGLFFYNSHQFTAIQNIFMGFIGGGGLVYFFYNFKRVFRE